MAYWVPALRFATAGMTIFGSTGVFSCLLVRVSSPGEGSAPRDRAIRATPQWVRPACGMHAEPEGASRSADPNIASSRKPGYSGKRAVVSGVRKSGLINRLQPTISAAMNPCEAAGCGHSAGMPALRSPAK